MRKARALWLVDRLQAELREEPVGDRSEDEVIIESLFTGVSRGTESLVANGAVPPGEFERMRAPLQSGAFPFPVKYGYAAVGEIVAGAPERIGQTVFCLHPHQDVFRAPAQMAVVVPDAVPASRAVLAANMETALNGVWDAGIMPGDTVAVIGGGVVGLLVAFLAAKVAGTDVAIVDVNPSRRVIGEMFGCRFLSPDETGPLAGQADVVIHTSASAAGLTTAISLAAFEAKVVEMSWFGHADVAISLGGAFHSQRLSIVASQVGHVPPSRRARWPLSRRLAKALELLNDSRLDHLVSGETDFDILPDRYGAILADPDTLCHRIRYR